LNTNNPINMNPRKEKVQGEYKLGEQGATGKLRVVDGRKRGI
jgi:hypothetical protein